MQKIKSLSVIILAAGQGKRMNSEISKVLHPIGKKPMILHTYELVSKIKPSQIIIVANKKNIEELKKNIANTQFILQDVQRGTADATAKALPKITSENVAVLYGDDTAFYKPETFVDAYDKHILSDAAITFVTLIKNNPSGLGRIIRQKGELVGIIEEKDATPNQRKISEVNDGLYFFKRDWLTQNLNLVKPSPVTGEYYLTDLIKLALTTGQKVETYTLKDPEEWHGINTPEDLARANVKINRQIHVMGIGGAGASALSAIAKEEGYEISGCDLQPNSAYKNNLKGIDVKKGHSPDHLQGIGQLILSSAILKNDPKNKEVTYAKKHNIPIHLWEQFQANVLQKDKFVIAVAGAYGKSTTTAMISKMLIDTGLDPTCEIGAKILDWGVNFRIGKSKYYVCEVDEYLDKFLNYSPDIAIVLNLGWDHPDYFKTEKKLINSYKKFVKGIKPGGVLIIPQKLVATFKPVATHLKVMPIANFGKYKLDIVGDFRKENADAVMTLASQLGLDSPNAKKSIESFKGAARRLELKGKIKSTTFYDDYAVQPYTVLKTASALHKKFPKMKMTLVFEPHTFSRINKFYNDFVSSLKSIEVDHIYVTNIYPAREKGDVEKLAKKIAKSVGPKASYSGSIEQTSKKLKKELNNYDLVLSMGAGNVYKIYDELLKND